ncbi:hypothetical protein [Desulfurivibrio dismutans]|uniref:hypothetical protein n=1 Tax=Desulfurivibrio dismutans TaxID=1398908 RepID=UPI0023D99299|nr:hypothetical protein [Desulfurivibrio alkaliphilus]MDF1615631.1 hypothetical protein [Desulfurivibrio alkaliphilus]
MDQAREANDAGFFLEQVRREAAARPLQVFSLPGGLVLLQEGLGEPQLQHFLALLSRQIAPPGLQLTPAATSWQPPAPARKDSTQPSALLLPEQNDKREKGEQAAGAAYAADDGTMEHCQVTVEERRQLFSCFQADCHQ